MNEMIQNAVHVHATAQAAEMNTTKAMMQDMYAAVQNEKNKTEAVTQQLREEAVAK